MTTGRADADPAAPADAAVRPSGDAPPDRGALAFLPKLIFERCRLRAESGDAQAQLALGDLHAGGHGVARDEAAAYAWYERAARQGLPDADVRLGDMHRDGRTGRGADPQEAALHYLRAAEHGSAAARLALGWMYARGQVLPRDEAMAVFCFREALAAGEEIGAAFALGAMYEGGRGVPRDGVQAAFWFERAIAAAGPGSLAALFPTMVEHGFADAAFVRGLTCEFGWAGPRDEAAAAAYYRAAVVEPLPASRAEAAPAAPFGPGHAGTRQGEQAFAWCRRLAERGDPEAQNSLGILYENGWGTAADDARAADWYRKAADRGLPEARTNLGRMLACGRGVPSDRPARGFRPPIPDPTEAETALRRAAEEGFAPAQYGLALLLSKHGRREEAGDWFERAAAQGSVPARLHLGQFRKAAEQGSAEALYRLGLGPEEDAASWLRLAAAHGHPAAQYELAKRHAESRAGDGSGPARAAFWFLKAAAQGHGAAVIQLVLLLSNPPGGEAARQAMGRTARAYENGLLTLKEALGEVQARLRGA